MRCAFILDEIEIPPANGREREISLLNVKRGGGTKREKRSKKAREED